jgi:hypothetical protein
MLKVTETMMLETSLLATLNADTIEATVIK